MKIEFVNKPKDGIEYRKRVGVYGILLDENNNIAIIKPERGYFLPGGGLEENENLEECLKREFLEETAMEIKILKKLYIKSCYLFSPARQDYLLSEGHFYECELFKKTDNECEENQELLWMNTSEAADLLFVASQKHALREYVDKIKSI